MIAFSFTRRHIAILAGGLLILGCGKPFPTYPVRGTVTLDGEPLPGGGSLRFVPTGEGPEAGGNIAKDGTFELKTFEEDGAVAGEHHVEVYQNTVLEPAVYPQVKPEGGREPGPVAPTKPEVRVPQKDLIPPLYGTPQSPLRVTVKPAKNEDVKIELKRKP